GKLKTKTIASLSSNADIIIGAYLNTLRDASMNRFSGLIKDVNLYDSLLSPSQILQIYEQNNIRTIVTVSNSTGIYNSTLVDQVTMVDAINLQLNSSASIARINTNSTLVDQVTMVDAINLQLNSSAYTTEIHNNSTITEQISSQDTLNLALNNTSTEANSTLT